MTSAFVGRKRELRALSDALAGARRGVGTVVLVAGEPGIGKTTLVNESLGPITDAATLWGQCWDEGGAPTYWPWVQILRGAGRLAGDDIAPELAACLEPLQLATSDAESTGTPGDPAPSVERFALFDAVTQLLHQVAQPCPLVVVIEDLHAGGFATALLLEFVARHSRHVGLVLVATYRDTEARLDDELARIVTRLEDLAVVLRPQPFDEAEVRALAETVLPVVDGGLATDLLDRTHGNPLVVAQALIHLEQSPGDLAGTPVPAALRQSLHRRADQVRALAPAPDALAVAAVIGAEVDPELIAEVLGVTAAEVSATAEVAVGLGILTRTGGPRSSRYAFTHALVRDAVYEDTRPAGRAAWHLAVARTLERTGAHPAVVARHYLAAWPAGGADEAADYSRRAADDAMTRLAAEDAVALYRDALVALGHSSLDRRSARCQVLLSLAGALSAVGRLDDMRSTARQAGVLADRLGAADLATEAALLGTENLDFNAVDTSAVVWLRDVDALWAEAESPLRARLLARLAVATAVESAEASAIHAENAVAMAEASDDPAALATALSARLHATWGRHQPAPALDTARRIVGLVPDSVEGLLWCAIFALENGDVDEATAAVAAVAALGDDSRRPTVRHLALSRRSTLAAVRGDDTEALSRALEAYDLASRCGLPDAGAVLWGQLFAV